MTYTFVKIQDTYPNIKEPIQHGWMFKATTAEDIVEFHERIGSNNMALGFNDVLRADLDKKHLKTEEGSAIKQLSNIKDTDLITTTMMLDEQIFNSKIKMMVKYGCIYIRPSGSYMAPVKGVEELDTITKNELIYPEYTEANIRINQFQGGQHYYAKIGNLDVVDEDGNQKWNTFKEAKRQALLFLEKENTNS